MCNELTKLLSRAHFTIHKWATNSPELLQKIPEELRAPTNKIKDDIFESEKTSSLGVRWDPGMDPLIP